MKKDNKKGNKQPYEKPSFAKKLEERSGRVMEILKKEYTFENWLLAILSPILLLYGIYIVYGQFGSVDLAAVLGNSGIGFVDFFFNTTLKRILTGSFLILIAVLVIVYLSIPFLRPSFKEMRKVSWPTILQLGTNSARVFSFLVFLMLVFALYGFIFDPIFEWLYSL